MVSFVRKIKRITENLLSADPPAAVLPDRYSTLIAQADAARDRSSWAAAADIYEAALALRPQEASIWVQLGNTSKEAGNFARALFAYTRALDIRPNDADVYLQLGHLHKRMGDKAEAEANYSLASRLDPSNKDAVTELKVLQAHTEPLPVSPSSPAPPLRKPAPCRLSFKARVVGTKTSLQELLRPTPEVRRTTSAAIESARPAILEAIAALDKVIQGDAQLSDTSLASEHLAVPVVFDVSDLMQYFRHHRLPTGIQRVQIEAISATILRAKANEDVRICCFTEEDDYWREVPHEIFLELCELSLTDGDWTQPEWRDLMAELDDVLHQGADFSFGNGAFLVNIGTSWWLQNYFLHVREAKRRSHIRYAPFVHDMIPVLFPEYCVEGLVKDFIGWVQGVYAHADFYFVNSHSTRSDLLKVARQLGYEIDVDRVRVVRLDADYRKSKLVPADETQSLSQRRLASGDYVLLVSTIEARKNHVAIFDAWLDLCKEFGDHTVPKLVCVGSRGWLNEAVFAKLAANQRLRDKVVMLSNVSDKDLAVLYRECLFSVYPSFYEGWGLPVTEALSYGKVVLASSGSSLPEAGGEFADYFELGDALDISSRLKRLIYDSHYRKERENNIRNGFKVRSWQSIAEDMLRAILFWSADSSTSSRGAPPIELGRYYSLSRNSELLIYRGLQGGEIFRSGKGWWGAGEWGCWLKPGPAEISFTLPGETGTFRLSIGLRAHDAADTPFDLEILPMKNVKRVLGVVKAGQTKWVSTEFGVAESGREIRVVLEGYNRASDRPRADLAAIEVSIGVVGIFVCATSDTNARSRFAEAVSLDEVSDLARSYRYEHGKSDSAVSFAPAFRKVGHG